MPRHDAYPPWVRLEGFLTAVPPLRWAVDKIHQQRKKRYMSVERTRDRNSPTDLRNFEQKIFSQYGEDGIVEEIFGRIGEGGRFVVEFGIEDGSECNARNLIENRSWAALLIDGSPADVEAARALYSGRPVRVLERFITAENILSIFEEAEAPIEPDLLSIDVDGNDYWLWKAILGRYRPRVVVIEYNGRWVPPKKWVMPYDPEHRWDGTLDYGASLASLANLGKEHGYALVGCGFAGLNAFFVREDLLGDRFPSAVRGTSYHYAAPLYGMGFGHPLRPGLTHRFSQVSEPEPSTSRRRSNRRDDVDG